MVQKDELNIRQITYALKCKNGKYYIGRTWNLNQRYAQHLDGSGAFWTQIHKPISIQEVWLGDCEKEKTLNYMRKYGHENVRGAGWCKMYINKPKELLYCEDINEPTNLPNPGNDMEANLPDNVG